MRRQKKALGCDVAPKGLDVPSAVFQAAFAAGITLAEKSAIHFS
jgi:hypothetical protein